MELQVAMVTINKLWDINIAHAGGRVTAHLPPEIYMDKAVRSLVELRRGWVCGPCFCWNDKQMVPLRWPTQTVWIELLGEHVWALYVWWGMRSTITNHTTLVFVSTDIGQISYILVLFLQNCQFGDWMKQIGRLDCPATRFYRATSLSILIPPEWLICISDSQLKSGYWPVSQITRRFNKKLSFVFTRLESFYWFLHLLF